MTRSCHGFRQGWRLNIADVAGLVAKPTSLEEEPKLSLPWLIPRHPILKPIRGGLGA